VERPERTDGRFRLIESFYEAFRNRKLLCPRYPFPLRRIRCLRWREPRCANLVVCRLTSSFQFETTAVVVSSSSFVRRQPDQPA
jgi:hypothetical protein